MLDILGLYSILLATMLPFAVSERVGDEERVDAGMLLGVLIADAVVVLLWAAARRSLMERLLLKRVGGAWIAFAGLISLGTFAFAFAFVEILKSALGAEEVTASEPFLEGGYGWGILILAVCVQPAVIEEIAFRGIILEALGSFLTRKEAIVVSSLMFTTIHLSAFGLPQLVLGVILAWLRLRTGSLLPCMALHFGHNLWVVLSEALLPV